MAGTVLLIGVGNPLRSDDGAGPLLAERLTPLLRQAGFRACALIVHQPTPELALEIAQDDVSAVVFIDAGAAQDGGAPMLTRPRDGESDASASHVLSAGAVLAYAARLYDRRPPAWLLTVPGCDFGFGDKLSPAVAALVRSPAPLVDLLVQALAGFSLDLSGASDAQEPAR